jgi:putative oxidoreductase
MLALRLLSGGVFVVFGIGKFVNHASELSSFESYGLPAPALFVVAIGLIELVGGLLLISGRLVRPTALVLAADMVGAIVLSGLAKGEIISLTLAPAELIAMLVLLSQRTARPSLTRGRTSGTATASDSPSTSQPPTMYGNRL